MKTMIGFTTLVKREIYRFVSVFRQTIFPPVISGALYLLIFGYSIGSRIPEINGMSYMEFLIPGLMMMTVIEGSYANTSSSLFISRWANNIEELLVTPLSYIEMVLAMVIGGLVRSFVTATGVYLVSLFFVKTEIQDYLLMVYFITCTSIIFSSLGMIMALIAEEFEHLAMATTFVITPLVFLGGVFHSIQMVPEAMRQIAGVNPMFYMINGLRQSMLGVSDISVAVSGGVVLILAITLFSIVVYLFKIGFKLRK